MSEPFIGQIQMVGFNFAPRGWALCNGQLLSIAQNTALFSLLGTTYGGNGQTTFGLPNLQGRVPMHQGQGPGLSPHSMGESAGNETVTLTSGQVAPHTHNLMGSSDAQSTGAAAGNSLGSAARGVTTGNIYAPGASSQVTMASQTAPSAGGQPHPNMQPYLVINFVIALQGIFPSRN